MTLADEFSYRDKTDGSIASAQGLRIVCGDDARVVLRLSGTGTSGATLRVYLERYARESGSLHWKTADAVAPLAGAIDRLARIAELTGRRTPDVVT